MAIPSVIICMNAKLSTEAISSLICPTNHAEAMKSAGRSRLIIPRPYRLPMKWLIMTAGDEERQDETYFISSADSSGARGFARIVCGRPG